MKLIYENSMTQRENRILPFLKMKIEDDSFSPLEINIRKSKKIINDETVKLIDEFQIMDSKSNMKNPGKQNKIFKINLSQYIKRKMSLITNDIPILPSDEFLKKRIINMKAFKNNKTQKYKKFKNFNLSSWKDKYLRIFEKCQYNDNKSQLKLLETSKSNNNSLLIRQNKSNSNLKINENQINKPPVSKTITANKNKFSIKNCNKSYSKIFSIKKMLQDSQTDSMKIIKKIKKYKKLLKIENQNITDILQKNENKTDKYKSNNNRFYKTNNNKLLGRLKKNDITKLQKLQINKDLGGEILMKKSTINLLKFGNYFNKMDDEEFFRERKKIINKFAEMEKDSNIIDGIKTERNKYTVGKGIQNNNKIIKQLAEDNYSFFLNVSKKYDNI